MKGWWLCLCTIFTLSVRVNAQEDLQAMLKQIALLGIYMEDLEKAMKIAKEGLTTIGEIKNGEFNLHSIFFSSLENVNPAIAKYSKIAVIISDELTIVSKFKTLIRVINNSGRLTSSEATYVISVYDNMSTECTKYLNYLIAVTTDGALEMTDDERISRIDGIYSSIKNKYAFTMNFFDKTISLCDAREQGTQDITLFKSLQ